MLGRMIGLEGLPLVDLEDLVDTRAFPEIDEEITIALIKASQLRSGTGGIYDSNDPQSADFILPTSLDSLLGKLTAAQRAFFESLGDPHDQPAAGRSSYHTMTQQQRQFLKITTGAYFSWQSNLTVRGCDSFETKHLPTRDYSDEIRQLLPRTLKFVESLPFERSGRVCIFGVDPLARVPTHRDREWGDQPAYSEFMNFAPGAFKKPFYVYDARTGKRVYPASRIYWFNEADYHGVDPSNHFTYSFRVDGVFKESFREEIARKYPRLARAWGRRAKAA